MEQAEEEMNVMVEKSLVSPNVLRAQLYDRETQNVQFVWDSGHAEQAQGILLQL